MSRFFKMLLATAAAFTVFFAFSSGVLAEGNKVGTVTASALNVRETPSTSAQILTKLYSDEQVSVIDSGDGWYKISVNDITGWVKADYLSVTDASAAVATITGDNVNLRSEGGTYADIISRMSYGTTVSVITQSGDWYNVSLADGTTGWVYKNYIAMGNVSRGDSLGRRIADFALKYQGVGYVYGGSSARGFDCSGFTKYVYQNFDIWIERVAADQAGQGTRISSSSLRVGDLVFFDTDGGHNYINHVGIYIGNGQFVHASSGGGRVMTSSMWEGFYANAYMTARTFTR